MSTTFGDDAALNDTVRELFETPSGGVATVATLVALYTLSRAFGGLIRALDVAYEVNDSRPWWYLRIVALGLGIGTVSVVAAGSTLLTVLPSLTLTGSSKLVGSSSCHRRARSLGGNAVPPRVPITRPRGATTSLGHY